MDADEEAEENNKDDNSDEEESDRVGESPPQKDSLENKGASDSSEYKHNTCSNVINDKDTL